MTVSRAAYQDLVRENEGLKEQLGLQLDMARGQIAVYEDTLASNDSLRSQLDAMSHDILALQTKLLEMEETERRWREALTEESLGTHLHEAECIDYARHYRSDWYDVRSWVELKEIHRADHRTRARFILKLLQSALASPQEPRG